MILLEFAAQGVRGVAPAGGRAALRPGYNVVAAEGPALHRLLEALLYPAAGDLEALPRAAGGPAGAPARAGLTLLGDDRITYRLVRDFRGAAQLHRFDAEKRSFALVSGELPEIAAFLQKTAGVPPAARLTALLSLSAAELPSRQGGAGASSAAAALAPTRSGLSPEQLRKKLGQLRDELEKAKVAEKLQFQLDGLQNRLFKLDEALRGGAEVKEGLTRAEAARAELEPVAVAAAGLGEGPEARLVAFEKITAKRDEALARVDSERAALEEAEAVGAPRPAWLLPEFWGGAGLGLVLALIGGAAAASGSTLRYLLLLDIPALGWAAWVALRWISALERFERQGRRRRVVDDWAQKVEAQYARDSADVLAAVKAAGVSKVGELREALGRLVDADAVVAEWRRRVAEWEGSPAARGAREERARVEAEHQALEARLSADVGGGFVRDVRSVELEIQRLEAEAAAPAPAAPAPRPTAPAAGTSEPLRALLERAAAELGGSPSGAARTVANKAGQALSGLSFQRMSGLQVDDRGGIHALVGGRPTPAMTLPAADRDLVYLALKLGFLEHALQQRKGLAVVEDAFAGLSDGARRFSARLLKQLARGGQIVHATTDTLFREAADHSA